MNTPEALRLRQFKIITIAGGMAIILIMIMMIISESRRREWEGFQVRYLALTSDSTAGESRVWIRQIENPDLKLADRCPSCHVGLYNRRVPGVRPQPFTHHPQELFKDHDPEKYGCSVCHGGLGRALDTEHSHDRSVDNPFLSSEQTEAYCGKCHLTVFSADFSLSGAARLDKGRAVFIESGCQGCHKVRGVGGMHGPDLSDLGSRTLHSFDFRRIDGQASIAAWHREHLRRPQEVSPGSIMPAFRLSEPNTEHLLLMLRGQFIPRFPLQYIALPVIREFKNERSEILREQLYPRLCAGCHGTGGLPDPARTVPFPVPTLANQDFQAVASRDFIAFTLHEGRGGRYMHAWTAGVSGLREPEFNNLITYVRELQAAGPDLSAVPSIQGSAPSGRRVFEENCAMCHEAVAGTRLAPGILSDDFLSIAADRYISENIVNGRANTAMPAWRTLSAAQLADLLAFIRSKQGRAMQPVPAVKTAGSIVRGDSLFYFNCTRCHGENGAGGIGPAILNPAFLKITDPGFIAATLTRGRSHSAMFGLANRGSKDQSGIKSDISDIITFMYTRRDSIPDYIPTGMVLGDPDRGRSLFYRRCTECHGQNGQGGKGPALHNQEFLNAASNGYLLATISLGRAGTPMPSWGRGSPDHPVLTARERQDIVARLRQWQTIRIKRDKRWIK